MSIKSQHGFSLLEVLISLIVILIGVLGVAGIQLLSLKNTDWARYQSQAAILATDMVNAIQINPQYWSTNPSLTVNGTAISGAALSTTPCTGAANCTPTQQAGSDVGNWGSSLATVLPNGNGSITCTATSPYPTVCTIVVNWTVTETGIFASGNVGGGAAAVQTPINYQTMVSLP